MPKKDGLTPKQAAFVQEYLIDLNATQAAIRAGYSEKTAHVIAMQLLKKTLVLEAISAAKAKAQERTEITVDYVLNGFKTVAERCMEAVPVRDAQGRETGKWKFNALGANKALENLGKYLGLFDRKTGEQDKAEAPSLIKDILEAFK